jgi:hypothetical protein
MPEFAVLLILLVSPSYKQVVEPAWR